MVSKVIILSVNVQHQPEVPDGNKPAATFNQIICIVLSQPLNQHSLPAAVSPEFLHLFPSKICIQIIFTKLTF